MKKIIIFLLLFAIIYFNIYAKQISRTTESHEISYLFDNSGSMIGYYDDKVSTFKIFSKALIRNTSEENDFVSVYLFNRTEAGRGIISPEVLFRGSGKDLILDKTLNSFQAKKGSDGDYATTNIIEALDKAIFNLRGNTGVIWIVTDNINDNTSYGDSSYFNTLEFYKRLRNDVNIRKILLFPIPEKISGVNYLSYGYVCYGIVYSRNALSQSELEKYDEYFRSSGIKQKPITLKPLDIGTIKLYPKITQSRISEKKLYFDGKALKGFGFQEGEKLQEIFPDLILKSSLYPYIIKSARLNVRLDNFISSDYSVKTLDSQSINPSTVSNVSPEGEVTGFNISFNMPEITPKFSLSTIFNEDFTVGGNLVLETTDVEILPETKYMDNFKELFALTKIPEIFQPVLKEKKIESRIPLEIRMKYGLWRIITLSGIIIFLLLVAGLIILTLNRKKGYLININNKSIDHIYLSALSSYSIYNQDLIEIDKLTKLMGKLEFKFSKWTTVPNKKITVN